MNNIEQRSDEWFEQRKFRFTGSEIHNLLGVKGLGLTGESYILKVAYNGLFGKCEDEYVSYDMERGIELEPLAFNKLKEILGKKFIELSSCSFFKYGEFGGASPDGTTSNNGVAEIKCPKPANFFKVVSENYIDPKYYDQIQMEMLSTGSEICYYFVYMIHEAEEYHHLIEVPRDDARIDLIKNRILLATPILKAKIEKLKQNKQWV